MEANHKLTPGRWELLRGDEDSVLEMAVALGIRYDRLPNGIDFAHSCLIAVIGADGRILHKWTNPKQGPEAAIQALQEKPRARLEITAKILTLMSRAGIVLGTPGPTGGYRLARPTAEISLFDVIRVFEDPEQRVMCPFGPEWCGTGALCPLHDTLLDIHRETIKRLARESFAQFEKQPVPRIDERETVG